MKEMKMKKLYIPFLAFGIMLISTSLLSQTEKKEDLRIKQEASMGAQFVSGDQRSSKFYEYRDVPNDFIFDMFRLSLQKKDTYFLFDAEKIRQDDARYTFNLGTYGKYDLSFVNEKTPHRFSFEGKTLYIETAPGDFRLADPIRIAAENAQNDTEARSFISGFLAGAHSIDLELLRNKSTLDFTYHPIVPVSLNLKVSRELRNGTRPLGAPLGSRNIQELPEPIDYKTTNMDVHVEYTKNWGTIRAGSNVSLFENDVQVLLWDSPFRITDMNRNSARGRSSLPPSNTAFHFYLNGFFRMLKTTRLNGSVSLGSFSQNESLLPYTINSALTADYAGALESPAETANAKAHISSINLSISSKLMKNTYLSAGFRYYDFANKTRILDLEGGYGQYDYRWVDDQLTMEPLSFTRSRLYANVFFNLLKNAGFNIGYDISGIERKGHAHEETSESKEEDKSTEGTFKASVDTHLNDWILLRLSYVKAKREWSLEGIRDIYLPDFKFKRFFQADRDRDGLNMLVDLSFVENFSLTLTYMLGKDRYPNSEYGLLKDDFQSYSLDLSYAFSKVLSLYAFYTYEIYDGEQASSRSGARAPRDTADDWTAALKDKVDTFGSGLNSTFLDGRLHLNVSYTYSKTAFTSDFYSPPGGRPDVAENFDKDLDTTILHIFATSIQWKMIDSLSLVIGYWYEQYELRDVIRNYWGVDYLELGGSIYLGALEPDYKYHVGYLKLLWSW